MWQRESKPIVGVFGFSGCAGDQLAILHMEDELVDFFTSADIKFFHMAQSHQEVPKVDIALIEGSINTTRQLEELKEIREKADFVVAIGVCSSNGGIQYLKDDKTFHQRMKEVYGVEGKEGEFHDLVGDPMAAKPIDHYIKVDAKIPGCPISKESFIPVYTKLIHGLQPQKYPFPVCLECKYQGNDCFLIHGKFCIGPVTSGGCNATCPSLDLPCVGCFGCFEDSNYPAMIDKLKEIGFSEEEAIYKIKLFGGKETEEMLDAQLKGEKA